MASNTEQNRRRIRAPDRYREDGTYYKGPKEPKQYFNNYYHTKLAHEEECTFCKEMIKKSYMHKHQRTKKCRIQYDLMVITLQMLSHAVEELQSVSELDADPML